MNEALMKHVERAVRPVCAGWQRKLAMREELLAHLTAIYHEELLRSGDEQTALAQAMARFGEPAALSRELERSLNPWQRLDARVAGFLEPYLEPGMDESLLRFGSRVLLAMVVYASVIFGLVVLGLPATSDAAPDSAGIAVGFRALLLIAFSVTAIQVALHAAARALSRGQSFRMLAIAGVASALLILLTGIFWWSVAFDLTSWWANLPRLALPMLLLLPPLIVWCAWLIEKSRPSRESLRRWTTLELDS